MKLVIITIGCNCDISWKSHSCPPNTLVCALHGRLVDHRGSARALQIKWPRRNFPRISRSVAWIPPGMSTFVPEMQFTFSSGEMRSVISSCYFPAVATDYLLSVVLAMGPNIALSLYYSSKAVEAALSPIPRRLLIKLMTITIGYNCNTGIENPNSCPKHVFSI